MKYFFKLLLLCITATEAVFGQVKSAEPAFFVDSSLLVSQYHSKVIGEDYTIYVNLPSNYDSSKSGRPVLYLTDGDWNMHMAVDCFSMLEQDYDTNTPIIVGIGYGDRKNMRAHDFEPQTGGPKFLSFIETELMPYIKSKYHTDGTNALFGYSYGGVFAAYVLFEHPGIFNTLLIGAPGNS